MREQLGGEPTYSAAERRVMDYFFGNTPSRAAERAEYEAHGLVFTNNLSLAMEAVEESNAEGESLLSIFYNLLSEPARTALEQVRSEQPDLWQEALELRQRGHKGMEPTADEPGYDIVAREIAEEERKWATRATMTDMFRALEQTGLDEDTLLKLCI